MNKRFKEIDKVLFKARSIVKYSIIIFAVIILVTRIVLYAKQTGGFFENALVVVVYWFVLWLTWIFFELFISFLCDVKIIRNKLYKESNKDLLELFEYETVEENNSDNKE